MVLFRVEKIVAVTLLDAAKTTMEQVGVQRMEMADRGVDDSRRLVTLYGDLRRLKDYLQRCLGAFRDRIELDLAEEDLPLLTASCRRGAEQADMKLAACTDMRERSLIQSKRDLLIEWAVEFATEPLTELPLPTLMPSLSPAIRGLRMRLTQKFARKAIGTGVNPYEDELRPLPSELAGPLQMSPDIAPLPPRPAVAAATAPPLPPAPPPPAATPMRAPYAAPVGAPRPDDVQLDTATEDEGGGDTARLLEINGIRDPRLRAMMALDMRALERALAASDYRLAAVHLMSVLEGAVIDHAIPRTLELGLSGMPDTWNPQDVLLRVFGENCQPRDRAAAHHVFAARNLVHPAVQLKAPIVVTALAFKKHLEFVAHALRVMGFTS